MVLGLRIQGPGGRHIDTNGFPKLGFVAPAAVEIKKIKRFYPIFRESKVVNGVRIKTWGFGVEVSPQDASQLTVLAEKNRSSQILIMIDHEPLARWFRSRPPHTDCFTMECEDQSLINRVEWQLREMGPQSEVISPPPLIFKAVSR